MATTINVGINLAQFREGMDQIKGGLGGLGKTVGKAFKVASAAVVGVGLASLKAGEQANGSLSAIAAQTGQSQSQLRETEKAIRSLSAIQGGFTAQQMRDGLATISRYGQTAEEQTHMLGAGLRLAQATGDDFGKSLKNLDALMVKFNADTEDAVIFTNMFATAKGLVNLSQANLTKGLQKLAPVVNASGLSYEFAAGALALMYQEGLNVTQTSSGMMNVFNHLLNPADEMATVLYSIGVSAFYANGQMRDQETVMWELIDGLDSMTDKQRGAAMAYMQLSKYGIAFLDNMKLNREEMGEMSAAFAYGIEQRYEYGRVQHMINERTGGFTEAIQKARNNLRLIFYAINDVIGSRFYEWVTDAVYQLKGFIATAKENGYIEKMAESIMKIVEAAVGFIKQIAPIVMKWMPKLIDWTIQATQWLGDNAEAVVKLWLAFKGYKILKSVIGVFGGLKTAVMKVKGKKAIGGLAPAAEKAVGTKGGKGVLGKVGKLAKAMGPKGWAVAAIGAGTVAAIRHINNQAHSINADFESMYIHTGSKTAAMAYSMAQNMGRMSEDAQTKMSELMRNHYDTFNEMYEETGSKSEAMSAVVSKYFGQQKTDVRRELREVEMASRDTWLQVYEETGDRTKATQAVVDGGYQEMKRQMQRNLRELESQYQYYGEALPAGMQLGLDRGSPSLFTAVGDFANGVASRFRSFFGISSPSTLMRYYGIGLGDGLSNGISQSQSSTNRAAETLSTGIRNIFDRMPNAATTLGERTGSGLSRGLNNVRGSIMDTARNIAGAVTNTLSRALNISSPSREAMEIGEQFGEGFRIGLLNAISDIKQVSHSMGEFAIRGLYESTDVTTPELTSSLRESESNNNSDNGSDVIRLEVPLFVDGREIARATVDDITKMQQQLKGRRLAWRG